MYGFFTLALTALMLISPPAWAVNIAITEGSLFVPRLYGEVSPTFALIGENFRLQGAATDTGSSTSFTSFTGNGIPGSLHDLDGTVHLSPRSTQLTYNGSSAFFVAGSLNFAMPAAPVTLADTSPHLLSTPFTLTGNVSAFATFAEANSFTGTPLETFLLSGQGTAVGTFDGSPLQPPLTFTGMRLDFQSAVPSNGTPVIPEPSTVLLVASGLAGIGLWQHQSQRRAVS